MPARLIAYCTCAVDHVTAADLKAAVDEADIHTNAEVWGIEDEAVVDGALSHLVIERVADPEGARFRLVYAVGQARPVLICVSGRLSADEMLEELHGLTRNGIERVRRGLRETVQEVALTLGWEQTEDMGIVLASQLAQTFASVGRGLIRDQNNEWLAVEDGIPKLVLGQGDDA